MFTTIAWATDGSTAVPVDGGNAARGRRRRVGLNAVRGVARIAHTADPGLDHRSAGRLRRPVPPRAEPSPGPGGQIAGTGRPATSGTGCGFSSVGWAR